MTILLALLMFADDGKSAVPKEVPKENRADILSIYLDLQTARLASKQAEIDAVTAKKNEAEVTQKAIDKLTPIKLQLGIPPQCEILLTMQVQCPQGQASQEQPRTHSQPDPKEKK